MRKGIWIGMILGGVGVLLPGCAKKKPAEPVAAAEPLPAPRLSVPSEPSAPSEPNAPAFEIWLVPAKDGDPSLPVALDGAGSRKLELSQMSASGTWVVPETISLAQDGHPESPGTFFLAVPESALGGEVDQATAQFREDGLSRAEGSTLDRFPIDNDPEAHVWFVPLKKLLGDTVWTIGPEVTHRLSLDFMMGGARRKSFTLLFHTISPIPQGLGGVTVGATLPSGPADLAIISPSGGRVVASSQVNNPLHRPARIYLQASPNAEFASDTQIVFSIRPESLRYIQDWVGRFEVDPYASTGKLRISRANVTRSGKTGTVDFGPGQWLHMDLQPGETAQVDWIAVPSPGTPICPRTLTQLELIQLGTCEEVPVENCHFDQAYRFRVSHFYGHLAVETRLTDPDFPRDRALSPELPLEDLGRVSVTRSGEISLNAQSNIEGRSFFHVNRFSCQGIF